MDVVPLTDRQGFGERMNGDHEPESINDYSFNRIRRTTQNPPNTAPEQPDKAEQLNDPSNAINKFRKTSDFPIEETTPKSEKSASPETNDQEPSASPWTTPAERYAYSAGYMQGARDERKAWMNEPHQPIHRIIEGWLVGPNDAFNDKSPLELIVERDFKTVLDSLRAGTSI